MKTTETNDCGDNGVQSSKFTPVQVTFFHWARDSVASNHVVVGGWAFDDKCRGA